jgi:isopentenyl-diphosphate delta-isomerase type 1
VTTTDLVQDAVRDAERQRRPLGAPEHVVVLDGRSRPTHTAPKSSVHDAHTPLHLAFSCHVVRADGSVLLTRRSVAKRTWPGVWTNACCGHPQLGETLASAVARRLRDELGLGVRRLVLAVPDFTYRAAMDDGTVEHELCPVLVAEVEGDPRPVAREVDDLVWVPWAELVRRAQVEPSSLSPWCVAQVARLAPVVGTAGPASPEAWLAQPDGAWGGLVHAPVQLGRSLGAAEPLATIWATPAPERGPEPVDVVADGLERTLTRFLDGVTAEAEAIDPLLGEVTGEVRGLVAAGGKRLRPAFVYWGHRATGADHDDAVFAPAAAVELLHTFALLHDDVMDRSATRRGRPAAHVALAGVHGGDDAAWFGTSAAILAGDLTYVWADRLFDGADIAPAALARARAVFTTLREEVVAGQYLDLRLASDPAAHELAAERVALLKSARYTVSRPLLLGAALAEPQPEPALHAALQTYGDAVGMAFQMRDDLLGIFGDEVETGKGTLDDLREGKRTVLALRALRLVSGRDRQLLRDSLGDPSLTEERAEDVRGAIFRSGAAASVEALITAQHARALSTLPAVPEPARSALVELAATAIERRS